MNRETLALSREIEEEYAAFEKKSAEEKASPSGQKEAKELRELGRRIYVLELKRQNVGSKIARLERALRKE